MSGGGTFWKPAAPSILRENEDDIRNADDVTMLYHPKSSSRMPLLQQRMLLPIYKHKRQILYAVEHYSVVVIVGETGCGKSTQLPQYLMDGNWTAQDFTLVVTQPRRMAATSLATRVAHEVGGRLGDKVGYTVRFDDQSSPQTQIKVSIAQKVERGFFLLPTPYLLVQDATDSLTHFCKTFVLLFVVTST